MNTNIIEYMKKSPFVKMISLLISLVFLFSPPILFAAEHVLSIESVGFWRTHHLIGGFLICFMMAVFPRISLAFLSLVTGTFGITLLGLAGWILVPHILVACIATNLYWHTDPLLVVIAWFIAFSGETVEKTVIRRRF